MTDALPVLVLIALAIVLVLQIVLLVRRRDDGGAAQTELRFDALDRSQERTERELRDAIAQSAQAQRTELAAHLANFQQTLAAQVTSVATQQNNQIDSFAQTLVRFGEQQQLRIRELTEANERRLTEIRTTLEQKIRELQTDNAKKLDEMRSTVDEKLHATLEQRQIGRAHV